MKTLNAVKLQKLILILFITGLLSCSENSLTPDTRQAFGIRAWDYSDKHFLLDTIYKRCFEDYFNNVMINSHTDSFQVDQQYFEVWIQTDQTSIFYRKAGLHVDLPKLPSSGTYSDSLKIVPNPEQGIRAYGLVRKLMPSEYVLNKYAGYVSFKIDIPDNYFAGVAYKRLRTGEQFGISSIDSSVRPNDTLVLKMIKVQNLVPGNVTAWNLKLRNIYQLPGTNIVETGFEFNTYYRINGVYILRYPSGATILTALGLDKYSNQTTGTPDNIFDFIPGRTIDPANGWIIFPSLKPFLNSLQNYHYNGKTIEEIYWYPEIYNEMKHIAQQVPNADAYFFKGSTP